MKKVLVVLVVLAMALVSSIALAADVTVGGSIQLRSRDFNNLDYNKDNAKTSSSDQVDTQERVMIDVNAKADKVAGKISYWNDFETMGRFEAVQASNTATTFGFREAWVKFELPGIPVTVVGGHQLLQLGNGWFFRSKHFGSDAWVAFNDTGANHFGLVNVKVSEGNTYASDDIDAYVIVDTFKISDAAKVGVDFTMAKDRANGLGFGGKVDAQNLGVNFNGKLGPVNLAAQIDMQSGKVDTAGTDPKFKGNEIVVQGNVPMDPVTINFTVARGSGAKSGSTDIKQFVNFLDIDPHYTFLYEYKTNTVCGKKNTGFCNTTALNVGASFAAAKNLTIAADLWFLQATEKVSDVTTASTTDTTNEIGTEVDVKVNWKLYDNLSWNWNLGYLDSGKALGKEAATGIQGILAFNF